MGFIKAALRRTRPVWVSIAILGMLLGAGFFVKFPPSYQGQVSLYLTMGPNENSQDAITDAQAVAQSKPVAQAAMKKLGLTGAVSSFESHVLVTDVTDKVLQIDYSADNSTDAVNGAAAIGSAFLTYQRSLLNTFLALEVKTIQSQLTADQQQVNSLTAKVTSEEAQPVSATRTADLVTLKAQLSAAKNNLETDQSDASGTLSTTRSQTQQALAGSTVLDPAALVHKSLKKIVLLYVGGGLLGGLAVGIGFVIIRSLISGRLRRRYDILRALGSPVRISVGRIPVGRFRGPRSLTAAKNPKIRRITSHLGSVLPSNSEGPATLAIVAVDELTVPAVSVAALAVSRAKKGLKVVLADLCEGSPAARLLGVTEPGVRAVEADGAHLVVAVPEGDEPLPAGPLETGERKAEVSEQLAGACESADVLLTLVSLDPSIGSEHLAGWATAVVVAITAGASSPERIFAIGELVRLADLPVLSAVLIGADADDQSLGVLPSPDLGSEIVAAPKTKGLFVAPEGAAIEN